MALDRKQAQWMASYTDYQHDRCQRSSTTLAGLAPATATDLRLPKGMWQSPFDLLKSELDVITHSTSSSGENRGTIHPATGKVRLGSTLPYPCTVHRLSDATLAGVLCYAIAKLEAETGGVPRPINAISIQESVGGKKLITLVGEACRALAVKALEGGLIVETVAPSLYRQATFVESTLQYILDELKVAA